tara:strand:+ start:21599 stop:21973 length:375 start_codon:yes stop_codon:yes gene_type:complete
MSVRFQKSGWFVRGIIVFCLTLMVFVAGVFIQAATSGGSTSGTLASGRSVTVSTDEWYLETMYSGDSAQIKTPKFIIMVAPEQVTVNGKPIATIESAVKAVDVNVQIGTVTILANGKPAGTYTR